VTLLELLAQGVFSGDDPDAWYRASDQWRRARLDDLRRGLALFGDPPKAAVWPVAYACLHSVDCLNTNDAERAARAALAVLADLP
jgi:hypothetical protein